MRARCWDVKTALTPRSVGRGQGVGDVPNFCSARGECHNVVSVAEWPACDSHNAWGRAEDKLLLHYRVGWVRKVYDGPPRLLVRHVQNGLCQLEHRGGAGPSPHRHRDASGHLSCLKQRQREQQHCYAEHICLKFCHNSCRWYSGLMCIQRKRRRGALFLVVFGAAQKRKCKHTTRRRKKEKFVR